MSDDIEKEKTKVELENLGRLVDRYAQSRSLGLLIPMAIAVINAVLIIGAIELVGWKPQQLTLGILFAVMIWVVFSSTWLIFKLVARYEYSFYRKDGKIELQKEKVSVWAWIAYIVMFLGPAILSAGEIIPVRWALTIGLSSFGFVIIYIGKKHREMALGLVYGTLVFFEVLIVAIGLVKPFGGEQWVHSYFATLMVYLIGAGLVTAVIVHIYNRKILHKIKEMRPFGEQQ